MPDSEVIVELSSNRAQRREGAKIAKQDKARQGK
jgi:hypothetical protein